MEPLTKTDLRRGTPARPTVAPITTEAEQAWLLAEGAPSVHPGEEVTLRGDAGDPPQHGD
jgi:hypothetical protein